MPRYFFRTEDREVIRDPVGEDLEDEGAARREAVRLMGSILNDSPEDFLLGRRWRVVVATEPDGDLFSLEVSMRTGAAISEWGDLNPGTPPR